MQNILKKYIREIDENALRQYIDAKAVFTALEAAKKSAFDVRGRMYWRNRNGKEYLIRTTREGKKSLGPRSEQNEAIFRDFFVRKQRVEKRVSDLRRELELHRKLNKIYQVGRAPDAIVAILNTFAAAGMSDTITITGTLSLYGFEAAAGIRFEHEGAFENEFPACDTGYKQKMNAKDEDIHQIIKEDELSIAQLDNAGVLADSAKLSVMIVSKTGRMARMNTLTPLAFVSLRRCLSEQPGRHPEIRARDILQAELVEAMAADYLPQFNDRFPNSRRHHGNNNNNHQVGCPSR